jgi:hypothetical protein
LGKKDEGARGKLRKFEFLERVWSVDLTYVAPTTLFMTAFYGKTNNLAIKIDRIGFKNETNNYPHVLSHVASVWEGILPHPFHLIPRDPALEKKNEESGQIFSKIS